MLLSLACAQAAEDARIRRVCEILKGGFGGTNNALSGSFEGGSIRETRYTEKP
jgi:hypothetical protein